MDQFERVLVTSPNDRQAFRDLRPAQDGGDRIQVLPNGVDLEYFSPDPRIIRRPATLVVTGKMSYHANITMALTLAQEIMPRVWQSRPDVRLQVVGKDPPAQLLALNKDPRIEVTGTVPDLRPYLCQATLAVAPVPYGAGIQNKVLEAMACATPVVTSSKAIAALSATPDEDIFVADQPDEFARKIVDLLENRERRNRLGQAGREYVQRCHNWNTIVSNLAEIYRSAIKQTSQQAFNGKDY
jgi:glycosyltransferase involved in cell wall biosynthesis